MSGNVFVHFSLNVFKLNQRRYTFSIIQTRLGRLRFSLKYVFLSLKYVLCRKDFKEVCLKEAA